MAARLRSVLKNQTLRLALKTALLTYLAFAYEYYGSFFYFLAFWLYLLFFYFSPSLNAGKYLKYLAVLILMFFMRPQLSQDLEIIVSLIFGVSVGLLIGVKNLVFIKRPRAVFIANILLVLMGSLVVLYGGYGLFGWVILFAITFAAGFDRYKNIFGFAKTEAEVFGAVSALLFIEIMVAISFLPILAPARALVALLGLVALDQVIVTAKRGDVWDRVQMVRFAGLISLALIIVVVGCISR